MIQKSNRVIIIISICQVDKLTSQGKLKAAESTETLDQSTEEVDTVQVIFIKTSDLFLFPNSKAKIPIKFLL